MLAYFARLVCWLGGGHQWARWKYYGPLSPARSRVVCLRCGKCV